MQQSAHEAQALQNGGPRLCGRQTCRRSANHCRHWRQTKELLSNKSAAVTFREGILIPSLFFCPPAQGHLPVAGPHTGAIFFTAVAALKKRKAVQGVHHIFHWQRVKARGVRAWIFKAKIEVGVGPFVRQERAHMTPHRPPALRIGRPVQPHCGRASKGSQMHGARVYGDHSRGLAEQPCKPGK